MNNIFNKLNDFLNLSDIYVPEFRKKDYDWLLRNFMIKNNNHKNAKEIYSLIKECYKLKGMGKE